MPCRDNEIPESHVQAKMMKTLHERGHYARKIQNACSAGTPDIIACVNGWFFAVEVKRPKGGRIAPLQELNRRQILMNGGVSLIAPSMEDFMEAVQFLEQNAIGSLKKAMMVVPDTARIPEVLRQCVKFQYNSNREERFNER